MLHGCHLHTFSGLAKAVSIRIIIVKTKVNITQGTVIHQLNFDPDVQLKHCIAITELHVSDWPHA